MSREHKRAEGLAVLVHKLVCSTSAAVCVHRHRGPVCLFGSSLKGFV